MALNKILLSDNVTELDNVKSVVFKENINAGEYLRPGTVGSASIEVEVYDSQANALSAGDVVYYYQIDKNNVQTLIGEFVCEPIIASKVSYKFVAHDNALKLDADFSQWLQANQANFPMTIYSLVSAACTEAGVTLGSASWNLSTENVQAFYTDGITCRDILSYAAELACCFVHCHNDGAVYFDWYSSVSNSIAPTTGTNQFAYKQNGLTYANYTTASLDRVAVHPSGNDDVAYIYPVNVTTGNTLHIQNNLLLTGADASLYNAVAQNVYTEMSALGTYKPMTAELFIRENPFRAGDIVSVTDIQSVSFSAPITALTVTSASATLESTGREYYEDTINPQKAITQLASDVVRINKLKVDWADINTAIVNYLTANNVTAQNLTIVDENGDVLATFNSSGISLGDPTDGHAEVDFNSFEIFDQNGIAYFHVGDVRDQSGIANIWNFFYGDGLTTTFSISPTATDTNYGVYVDGTPITSGITKTTTSVTFDNAPADGDNIMINYDTADAVYYYDIGTRNSGTNIGEYSIAGGMLAESSGSFSTVSGGRSNHATGTYSTVSGGNSSTASGIQSTVGGGAYNTASGRDSTVGGGTSNSATADYSTVCGGDSNEASGNYSAVGGGRFNVANHRSQMVFGEYNDPDPSTASPLIRGNYVEIVGNGTADNARSNARTLDWSGNETLAGGLTIGGALTLGTGLSSPLPIADGGTGQSSVSPISANVISNTLPNNVTLTSVSYAEWGKVATLVVELHKAAVTNANADVVLCTLVTGKRPAVISPAVLQYNGAINYAYINTSGQIRVKPATQIPNPTDYIITATYVLA